MAKRAKKQTDRRPPDDVVDVADTKDESVDEDYWNPDDAGAAAPTDDESGAETPEAGARSEPEDTKPEDAEPEPEDAQPEDAKPEDAKPEDAKPEDAKPEDAKPEDALARADSVPEDSDVDEVPPPRRPAPTGTDFDEFAAAAGTSKADETRSVEGKAAWTRLLKMSRPRTTRSNLLVALLAVLLGAGIAAQVQLTNQRGLDELSQTDLVRVLDDVSLRASRLDQQVRELETTRDRLKSGTGTTAEALDQAQKRVDTLGILAGTIPAKGPGIMLRISDPDQQVTGTIVLDIIQELRDAGAESIDVGGVRVVASSFVGERDGDIVIDGTAISRPIVITAIGDSTTLSSAMTIPGGIVESVRQKGANASISESSLVEITSTHAPAELKNAKPVE